MCQSSSMRADLVSKVFERATDASVSAEERILPILDLCWLYWDTDCILIQACGRSRRPHQLAKLLNVANEADAIRVALEVRFTIQEDFAMLAMGGSASSDIMQAQAHILFRPSLKLKCLQDACNCLFGSEYAKHISELVSQPPKLSSNPILKNRSIQDKVRCTESRSPQLTQNPSHHKSIMSTSHRYLRPSQTD